MKIILVEDEIDLLEMLTELCEDLGYKTAGFTHPMEALQYLEQNQGLEYMVVSDYNLPKMNGQELMQNLRAKNSDVPFIFWSGFWDETLRAKLLSHPKVQVLDKPFDLRLFSQLISEVARAEQPSPELQVAG